MALVMVETTDGKSILVHSSIFGGPPAGEASELKIVGSSPSSAPRPDPWPAVWARLDEGKR